MGALRRHSTVEVREQLAERIRAHRIARGWTQRDVAARAGMAFETYRVFERTGRISLDRFLRLLELLGLLHDTARLVPPIDLRSVDEVLAQQPRAPRQRAARHKPTVRNNAGGAT